MEHATSPDAPRISEIRRLLGTRIACLLSIKEADLSLSLLSESTLTDHGSTVVLIGDSESARRAVILLSAQTFPLAIERAMSCASRAKAFLGAELGRRILDPVTVDRLNGLSYAVLPYCDPISYSRSVWWSQKILLGPALFDWLWQVNRQTLSDLPPEKVNTVFLQPLRRMATMPHFQATVRAAASRSIARLESGNWTPKSVLMHGDLWKGNVLLTPSNGKSSFNWLSDNFAVIDWGGSLLCGYAIYDLVRLGQSFGLRAGAFSSEIHRHCKLLDCDAIDAQSYLLSALGDFAERLERFPLSRYLSLVDGCFTVLERLVPHRR